MKKSTVLLTILSAAFALFPFLSSADNNASVSEILGEIKRTQNIGRNQDIDCGKVTSDQFDKLGDALESVMNPDEEQHGLMEQMMGGEGSNSLKAMHIMMGRRYLGCSVGYYGMMGGYGNALSGEFGMMNSNAYGGMMGMGNWGYGSWFGWIGMFLFWILVIAGILAFIKLFKGNTEQGKKPALDILKERYARGEIDKNEFEERKKGLI